MAYKKNKLSRERVVCAIFYGPRHYVMICALLIGIKLYWLYCYKWLPL